MAGLRVLLTNITLASRTGTETYIRDLAIQLLKLGHTPIVYSTHLSANPQTSSIMDELRWATVPVVERLEDVGEAPDIIHGHHHPGTLTALLYFPHTPGIFVCHDWMAWHDQPPIFPRIQYYVAVDYTCRDRLMLRHGIPEQRTTVIHNSVDLAKFKPRSLLPAVPTKALVFSNQASEQTYLKAVQDACQRTGIELDVVGSAVGNPCFEPEKILGNYDLVFAKARCALESMAVGTAVIVCDYRGVGGLVTTENLHQLRKFNFGIRTLQNDFDPDFLVAEINRYSADDAMNVSQQIRAIAGLEVTTNKIVDLYHQAIEQYMTTKSDPADEQRFAAKYLQQWFPRYGEYEQAQAALSQLSSDHHQLEVTYQALDVTYQALDVTYQTLQQNYEHAQLELAQCHQLQASYQTLQQEYEQVQKLAAQLSLDQEQLQINYQTLTISYATLRTKHKKLKETYHFLEESYRELNANLRGLQESFTMRLRDSILTIPGLSSLLKRLYRSMTGRTPL